jgi:signal transduction histidine kinase
MATATLAKPTNLTEKSRSVIDTVLFWVAILTTIVTAIGLVVYLVTFVQWYNRPFMGASFSYSLVVNSATPNGQETWNGLQAGLRNPDRITSVAACSDANTCATPIDVVRNNNYSEGRDTLVQFLAGQQLGNLVQVNFERRYANIELAAGVIPPAFCQLVEGALYRCSVQYTLQRYPTSDLLAFFIIPYITAVIMFSMGLLIFSQRSRQGVALLGTICVMQTALFVAGLFNISEVFAYSPIWVINTALLGGTLVVFGLVFPTSLPVVLKRLWGPWLIALPYIISVGIAIIAALSYINPDPFRYRDSWQYPQTWAIIGLIVLLFNLIVYQRPLALTNLTRNQTNSLILGIILMFAPVVLWLVFSIASSINPQFRLGFSLEATMPFLLTFTLSVTYSLLYQRPYDSDRLVSQTVTYTILLLALTAAYFLVVLGASLLVSTPDFMANNPLLVALTIFAISIAFLPLRNRLQNQIDALYFRQRKDFDQQTAEFGRDITSVAELNRIVDTFRSKVDENIAPNNIFVFLPSGDGKEYESYGDPRPETDIRFDINGDLIKYLRNTDDVVYLGDNTPWPGQIRTERTRLSILKPAAIVSLPGTKALNGFVTIGNPRSSRARFDYEEIKFLNTLSKQMSVALERTQVVKSLSRRVNELDVLSQISQAVNFTIEEDALLELINTQTNKLIRADYFYIVLRDQRAENQIYFAFFVEADERYREKEGQRWLIGRGLHSEVIQTSKPIRTDNYQRDMAEREAPTLFTSTSVRSWMGVPLIAGTRTIGVMAIANDKEQQPYTDEQLEIFNNIATLAATSLDKARLFAETNERARQLAFLNEVSSELVSTESDVEKLLDLITDRAVKILNAEAGSLFLVTEDGTNDLEFKVVQGGTQDLLGQRVKAGKGVVGQVAKRNKPQIVNDTKENTNIQDLSQGRFVTSSLMAVPLAAKNRVIGVLEVLNRRDGGIFTEEDQTLLTTFASQAAVAIENARLFNVTEVQLGKRIAELEALERIDAEMNRSLDLRKVAQIAIRWGIAQTGASGGVLGLVVQGEPPMLQVLAMHGYDEQEYPAGAEGLLWPLDRGIVSRVLRTRQPDLVTETSIDRDYIPSLRNAYSQITIPMSIGGEIAALLVLESDNKQTRLSLLDQQFAQRLGEHAIIAIENARLTARLTESISSKSDFMGFAAHELKNPLSSVKGFASLMLTMGKNMSDEQKNEFLTVIGNNADRMQSIIDDLRDSAAADAGKLKVEIAPIKYINIVRETLISLQKRIDDKLQTVVNNVREDLPLIQADGKKLTQVLVNLVSNAHKYSSEESTIILNAEVVEDVYTVIPQDSKSRKQKQKLTGPYLYCTVEDNGIGMKPEDVKRMFKEQYFRADEVKEKQEGTGLGMMVTNTLVQLHHGEIWVTSTYKVGTTFHFVIPLAANTETEPEPASD